MSTPQNPNPNNTAPLTGLDLAVSNINSRLLELDWLSKAHPIADVFYQTTDSRARKIPVIYDGGGDREYIDMQPNDHVPAFVWHQREDSQDITDPNIVSFYTRARMRLVAWWDYRAISSAPSLAGYKGVFIEKLKADLVAQLQAAITYPQRIYHDPANVFSGWDIDHGGQQGMAYPFGALRIDYVVEVNYNVC